MSTQLCNQFRSCESIDFLKKIKFWFTSKTIMNPPSAAALIANVLGMTNNARANSAIATYCIDIELNFCWNFFLENRKMSDLFARAETFSKIFEVNRQRRFDRTAASHHVARFELKSTKTTQNYNRIIKRFFFVQMRTTRLTMHKASCNARAASSNANELEPRKITDACHAQQTI